MKKINPEPGRRLRRFREEKGITQEELAKLAGVSKQLIQKDEAGERAISVEKAQKYAPHIGVTALQILDLDSQTVSGTASPPMVSEEKPIGLDHISKGDNVPIVGKTTLGADYIDLSTGEIFGHAPRHPNQEGYKDAVAMPAPGSSMEPRYQEGELFYVNRGQPPTIGQDCLVELSNGHAYLKRYEGHTGGRLVCRQYNPQKKWTKSLDEIKAIHAVVGRA